MSIVESQQVTAPAVDAHASVDLEQEREKHRRRAEKFGTAFVEPGKGGKVQSLDAQPKPGKQPAGRQRKVYKKEGFKTGIDLFSEEQLALRKSRAERFNVPDTLLASYQPAVDAEDIAKRKQRAQRFGTEYQAPDAAGLMDVDLLEPRPDPAPEAQLRPDAVNVYGVDLLSTKETLAYFREYGPSSLEWINDSSCNVVFDDEHSAKRAIVGLGRPIPPDDAPDGAEPSPLDPSNPAAAAHLWHKGPDAEKQGVKVPLIFRMATTSDVKQKAGGHITRELWKLPAAKAISGNGPAQHSGKGSAAGRKRPAAAEEPEQSVVKDVAMRGERGGKRIRERKRRRQLGMGEVDMADADEDVEDVEDGGSPAEEVERVRGEAAVADLRELLSRGRAAAERGLFSAAAAGVVAAPAGENNGMAATAEEASQ